MNNKNKKKNFAHRTFNSIETLRSHAPKLKKTGEKTIKKATKELFIQTPKDFMDQLFGPSPSQSAEIRAGESLKITDNLAKETERRKKVEKLLIYDRKLQREESVQVERRTNELRIQLQAIMQEVVSITNQTEGLAQETKTASMQIIVDPGAYHISFFENLLASLKSYRKKIENASTWLSAMNGRTQKKNYWSLYKKHGAKFLLSGEHYLTRSAG